MPPMESFPGAARLEASIAQLAKSITMGRYPWWFPEGARNRAIDYFVYGTDFTPLAISATTQNPINIDGSSAFCILSAVKIETFVDNTTFMALSPLLCRLTDGGSGRLLSNQPVHIDNWFGTAQEPKYWDVPKILAPNTTLGVELQNQEAVARNVRLAFHGIKIFGFRPGN